MSEGESAVIEVEANKRSKQASREYCKSSVIRLKIGYVIIPILGIDKS
jgi:hypothetical protein